VLSPSPGGSNHWLLAGTAGGPVGYHIENEKCGQGGIAGLRAAHGQPHPAGEHAGQGREFSLAGGLLPGPELHVQNHNLCRHGAVSTSVVKRMPLTTKTAIRTAVCVLSMGERLPQRPQFQIVIMKYKFKSFFSNHYPIPPTLGIPQARRITTSCQVHLGT